MVIKLEIKKGRLIGINEKEKVADFGKMPEHRKQGRQMRWKDGSFLDSQQVEEEKYQTKMRMA